MRQESDPTRTDRVNALMRGLAILQLFSDKEQTVAVSQMARHLGVHRSNASRLAATLHEMGFLSRPDNTSGYRLGPQLIRLGRLADRGNDVVQRAMDPLRALVAETGETGHVGVLDGVDAITAAVVDGWHTVRMHSHPNKRSPAHCSSLGKALLSGLDDEALRQRFSSGELPRQTPNSITSLDWLRQELELVRARGYAVDNEEYELDLRCVAAPIFNADRVVVASLGLSGPALRLTEQTIHTLAARVRSAAAQASAALGGAPWPAPSPRAPAAS